MYYDIFGRFFLEITLAYYEEESETLCATSNAKAFLIHVSNRSAEECDRADAVLPRGTKAGLLDVVDQSLLCRRLQWLAEGGTQIGLVSWHVHSYQSTELPRMMDDENKAQLQATYSMFARVDGQKVLLALFKIYVQACRPSSGVRHSTFDAPY